MKKLKYYIRVIRWLYVHRDEKNNRQKQRRFEKEVGDFRC